MYELIKSKPVFFPDAKKHGIAMSDNCKDFINKCLAKKPDSRIGSKNGVKDILAHPWFASIDQNALVNKTIKPTFKPKLSKDACDISNFDKMFTSEEAVHSVLPMSAQKKINKVNSKFSGFDWIISEEYTFKVHKNKETPKVIDLNSLNNNILEI